MYLWVLSLLCAVSQAAPSVKHAPAGVSELLDVPIKWSAGPQEDDFVFLCRTLRVPCGEEKLEGDSLSVHSEKKIRLALVAPREILRVITQEYPAYRWSVAGGVLQLRLDTKKRSALLQTPIPDFVVDNGGADDGVYRLAQILGIEFPPESLVGPISTSEDTRKSIATRIHLREKNRTAEYILQRLVAKHGHAIWKLVHRADAGYEKSNLYFAADVY